MIYIYFCEECGIVYELKYSTTEDRGNPCCDFCGSELRRRYTVPAIRLSGSGWTIGSNAEVVGGEPVAGPVKGG